MPDRKLLLITLGVFLAIVAAAQGIANRHLFYAPPAFPPMPAAQGEARP